MRHEFIHCVLPEIHQWAWRHPKELDDYLQHLQGLDEGLADYLPCSFKGDPNYGETQFLNIKNRLRFDEQGDDPKPLPEYEREVWSGAFWELREGLGTDAQGNYLADVLLLRTAMDLSRTVMDLSCPIAGTDARVDFLRQLLEQEHRVTSRRFASRIRDVFRGRGLEL